MAAQEATGFQGVAYQILMMVLCLYAITALALGAMLPLGLEVQRVLQLADLVVCSAFFLDFLVCFYRVPNRLRYLLKWGWIDLLSAVPMVDAFRFGRLARLMRIIRILRALRATKILSSYLLERRTQSALFSALGVTFLMVVFSAITMLTVETSPESNITSAEDALWWAITTVTTVGYGDRYPVTSEGRAIAAVLMTVGVGLFGVVTGAVAAWFISPAAGRSASGDERP